MRGRLWPSARHLKVAIGTLLALGLGLTASCARVQPHVQLPDVQLGEPSFFPTLEAYANAGRLTPILENLSKLRLATLAWYMLI